MGAIVFAPFYVDKETAALSDVRSNASQFPSLQR
jgi:hypothetical protein